MADNKYPNSGVLWNNKRKTSQSHPDFTGSLELDADLLRQLIELARENKPIKMDLSGWKKQSQAAGTFLSITAKKAWEKDTQAPARQAPPPRQQSSFDDDDSIPF